MDYSSLITIAGGIITAAMGFGALKSKINAQNEELKLIRSDVEKQREYNERIIRVETKIDVLLSQNNNKN